MSLAHEPITPRQAVNDTTDWSTMDWKQELQNNIHNVADLKAFIDLSAEEERDINQVVESHPMNIPRYYLSLIDRNDPNDPIRKLAVPTGDELVVAGQMGATTGDPYGDDKHDKGNGVLHKYGYTALVVATEYCSMYCRHCFRKRLVGLPNDQTVQNFHAAADYIAAHPEISNVVVSGGDPMMLPTSIIRSMLDTLRSIPHLNFVRIGTRAPVVYPLRFQDEELIEYLADFNQTKTLYVPTHFNHPNEITPQATDAVKRLRNAGIAVNNQAVLLRGINDDEETLVQLMSGLTRIGVNPYYLYQCMPVSRVRHHFQVPLKRGVDMVDRARSRLDGYAKRFKFILGHDIGKIEICGRSGDNLILKQIHARVEEQEQASRIMIRRLDEQAGWLDDMEEIAL